MSALACSPAPDSQQESHPVVNLEERSWLPRHCQGDNTAFPALLSAYRRPVYSFLVRSGIAPKDRDDLFQSVFLKIHTAAKSYEPSFALAPWLFTIVANTVRNHFRGERNDHLSDPSVNLEDWPEPQPDPERATQARETILWLEQAIAALPSAQREVLVLVTVADLPQQEVADSLALPLNTVKTHLRRARLALATAMAEREASTRTPGDSHETL